VADTSPVAICEKSRRVGISWAEAAASVLDAASAHGQNGWYLAYSKDMTSQFIEDCAFWARSYSLAASAVEEVVLRDDERDVQAFRIRFASGHHVTALSSRPRNLRSKQGRVILDEYAFHDDQDELLKAAMALLMWGGCIRIISTHNGEQNAFNVLVEEVRKGRRRYSLHRTTLDDALAEGLYQRICLTQGRTWSPEAEHTWRQQLLDFYGEGADEELFCIPRQGSGRYFTRLQVEACMQREIPVLRLAQHDGFALLSPAHREGEIEAWCDEHLLPYLQRADGQLRSCYGMDFARSGDLSVLIPAQEQQHLARRALFVLEMRNIPFEQQRQVLFYVADRLPRFVAGAHDATGNGAYLAEVAMQRYGPSRIHEVKLSPSWYLENMPRYKAAFEDAQIALPADADLLDDHMDVERVNGVPLVPQGRVRRTANGQRHGDGAIAGCLMWFASLHAGAAMEFGSVGPRASSVVQDRWEGGRGDSWDTPIDEERGFGSVRSTTSLQGYQ
jgi:phage FluMu gp28-like protein